MRTPTLADPTRSDATCPDASHLRHPAARVLRGGLALAGAAIWLAGCSVQPWVKPYERDRIADPIMSFDTHPVSSAYIHHVYEAREGARGATGSAGGGCGCN